MSSTPRKPLSYVPPQPPSSLHPSDYITSPTKLQCLLSVLKHRPPTRAEYAALLDYEGRARIRKREEILHPNIEFSTPIDADLHGCYKQFTEAFGTFKQWENAEDFDDSDQDDQWPLVDDWVLEDELNAIEQRDKRRDYRKKATRWEYEQILQKYEPTYAAAMTKELKSKSLAMGGDAKSINRLTQQHKPTMMVLLELAEEVARLEMPPELGDAVSELTTSRRSNGVPNALTGYAPSYRLLTAYLRHGRRTYRTSHRCLRTLDISPSKWCPTCHKKLSNMLLFSFFAPPHSPIFARQPRSNGH